MTTRAPAVLKRNKHQNNDKPMLEQARTSAAFSADATPLPRRQILLLFYHYCTVFINIFIIISDKINIIIIFQEAKDDSEQEPVAITKSLYMKVED